MAVFNESNTVEAYLRDLLAGPGESACPLQTDVQASFGASYGPSPKGTGWRYVVPS